MVKPLTFEAPRLRLDSRPLDRKAVAVEAQTSEQRDVIRVAVQVVAGEAGRLGADAARELLPGVPVAGLVAAFDLMSGSGRSPQKGQFR